MNWLWRFYAWYDQVKEPARFCIAMTMAAGGFFFLVNDKYFWLRVVGALYFTALVLTRIAWVHGLRRREIDKSDDAT